MKEKIENNIDKDIEIVKELKEHGFATLMIKYNKDRIQTNTMVERALENVLSELEKKDKIIFKTKKYLENMTKSSIRDKDGYYLGNCYVLQSYELEDVIDILKGKENNE